MFEHLDFISRQGWFCNWQPLTNNHVKDIHTFGRHSGEVVRVWASIAFFVVELRGLCHARDRGEIRLIET